MSSRLRAFLGPRIERALRPYGYRLMKAADRYGIDAIIDVTRLARLWDIDMALTFDVGANLGAGSLAFRAAWPGGEVVAFEPNGGVARRLRANVASVGGVSVEETALGARSGRSDLFIYGGASDLSSLKEESPYTQRFGLRGEAVSVAVTTVDEFCRARSIERINLLKIDAEGADHEVLLGAQGMIADRRIDFVYCEFNALEPERAGSLIPIATLLGAHGYDFVASYNDYIVTDGPFFSVSNALFAAGRDRA